MAITDRSGAVSSDIAAKLPVRCATTANISLSGEQTIDGIAVEVDERVLVKNQTTGTENGIYDVAAGAWSRSADCSDAFAFTEGTMVLVLEGTLNGDKIFAQTAAAPEIGTTSMTFASINLIGDTGATGATGADGDDGDDAFVYIAYASDNVGTGFTTTFNASLDYIAIKSSTTALTPVVGDFAGLWKNYKGAAGTNGTDGSDGADGAGYGGTSTTSILIGTGSVTFTTQADMAYQVGARVRLSYTATPTDFIEGVVTAYSGTSMTITVDTTGGSGTQANWNLNLAGEPGETGATGDTGDDGAAGAAGATGATGATGSPGLAYPYTFDTGTTAVDPGSGQISGNAADLSTATALYLNETGSDAVSIAAVLSDLSGCTASRKGFIKIVSQATPANWVLYKVTAVTDNGAWETLTVTYVAGSVTSFAADHAIYVQIARATDVSSVVGKHTVGAASGALFPALTNGCADLAQAETTTNKINYKYLAFDPTSTEYAWFWMPTPKSYNASTVTMRAVWTHPSTSTNFGVRWAFEILSLADDDAIDTAVGTAVGVTDTGGTTQDFYTSAETSAITASNTPAKQDWLAVRVSRLPGNAADTMAVDAHLIGVEVYYVTDSGTDD